jgi:hypothetical protein
MDGMRGYVMRTLPAVTHMDDLHAAWWAGNIFSLAALGAIFSGWLPVFVALVPLIYYGLMIYDHPRMAKWRQHRRERKMAALKVKLARLQASQEVDKANS